MGAYYTEGVPTPDTIYIFSPDAASLQAVRNPRTRSAFIPTLMFHQALTTLHFYHRDTRVILVWSPIDTDLVGQRVAKDMAAEATRAAPPLGLERIQSAAYQKFRAKVAAFGAWQDSHKREERNRLRQLLREGDPCEEMSHAWQFPCARPPSINRHNPIWSAATATEKDAHGRVKKRCFDRKTTSTALQIAVDHAFTGSYVSRFRPNDPIDALYCPCGIEENYRIARHIIYDCPRYGEHFIIAGIYRSGVVTPYHKL